MTSSLDAQPIKELIDRANARDRSRVLKLMAANHAFPRLLRDHGHLNKLIELVGDDESLKKQLADVAKEK